MLSPAEATHITSRPSEDPEEPKRMVPSRRYPSDESAAFPVVLRADVENAALRDERIGKGAARDTVVPRGSINVLMYRRMGETLAAAREYRIMNDIRKGV